VELKVAQKDFLKALETIGSVVSARPTLPILGNVLIEVRKGEAVLTATDLEVRIELKVKASVKREGKLTVPAKKLLEIVREMPSEELQIEFDSAARMLLSAAKCEFKMLGLPVDEFPQCPEVKRVAEIKVGAKVLVEMIRKTLYSVSGDETRYVLNGALLEWEKGELRMITTDGRRLAFMKRPLGAAGGKGEAIVPTKALQELVVLLAEAEGDVAVLVGEGYARFSTAQVDLVTRLIDGTFPDYDQVIPKGQDKKMVVETAVFLAAARRVSLMATDRSNQARFDLKEGMLNLSSASHEVGEVKEDIPVKYSGEALSVAYNAKFLIDVLKNTDAKEVQLELSTALAPGLFRPVGDDNYLCVVMPIRL